MPREIKGVRLGGGNVKLVNINFMNKNINDLKKYPGVKLKITYNEDGSDSETEYDILYKNKVVAQATTATRSGLIKYFSLTNEGKRTTLIADKVRGM